MEEDDSDSDCTALLTDFVDKPQKVDAKRRRLRQLQDRSKQSDHDNDNTAQNDNKFKKNWLITKYLSGINKTISRHNISDIRRNDYLHENAPDTKTFAGNTENTAKLSNDCDIICLDSDDETKSNDKSQDQDTNKGETEISSVNELLHETKLIVLKPAVINARRATTSIIGSHKIDYNGSVTQTLNENKRARLKVLKPSAINARRATTHSDENNLQCNSSNGKSNVSLNYIIERGNNEQSVTDSHRFISPRLSPLARYIPNTTSNTISGTNNVTGKCVVTQAENSLASILTVPNNKGNTDISYNTIIGKKYFQQNIADNTVSDVNANERFGNNESQIEPKRIIINLKPKCLVKQHEDTEQIIKEQSKASELCEAISNEEHAKEINVIVRREKCDGDNENNMRNDNEVLTAKTCNKVCEADKKLKENILPDLQKKCKLLDEQLITERHTKLQILHKPLGKQDADNAKLGPGTSQAPDVQKISDPHDKQDISKMQENQDAKKIAEKHTTSEISIEHDSNLASKVQIQQTSVDHEKSINQDEIIINENQVNQNFSYVADKTTGNKISKELNACPVILETASHETNTETETNKDQDLASEVLTTEGNSEILDKTILSTKNAAQESNQVQNEMETSKVQNKQITSKACDNQETKNIYGEQITPKTPNTEVVSKVQNKNETCTVSQQEARKVRSEQTTELHGEQGTVQRNNTPTETEVIHNVGAENNKRVLKFQIIFLNYILEHLIKDRYPESEKTLKHIIQTLFINARNGTFQSHVQYACPECGCLSNYSSSLLNSTKCDVKKVNSLQNCGLCRGVREIHTAYLEKISNKKDHITNKQNVNTTSAEKHHAKQSLPQKTKTTHEHSHSKQTFQQNDNNDSVSRSVEDRSVSLAVNKEKQTLTQNDLEVQTGNHNVSEEHKIYNETPFIEKTQIQENIKITCSDMNETVSIEDKLTTSNKRTKENYVQRMKTATNNNNTENKENLETKDSSLHVTTDFQIDNTAIENNNKMEQPRQININSVDELPKNILSGIHHVILSIDNITSCSKRDNSSNIVNPVVVVNNSDTEFNRDVRFKRNDNNTAEKAPRGSPAEIHMHTTNLNTEEMALKPKSHGDNNIISASTDQLKKKSDNDSNIEGANQKGIDLNGQLVSSLEVDENERRKPTAITNQTTTNSRNKRKRTSNDRISCKDDEGSYDDESSSDSDTSYKTSEASDKEDYDKRDDNKTKTLNTSGEGTGTDKNAHSMSKRPIFTFICKVCHQRLYTDYAKRRHRLYQHPDMVGRPLFKKVKYVEPKGNTSTSNKESKRFLEDNSSTSSEESVNVEQVNSTRDIKVKKRCRANKGENISDSDWNTESNSDYFNASSTKEREAEKNKRCTDNTETVSEDEIIKASGYLARKRKKRNTEFFDVECRGSRADTNKENVESEASDSDWIVNTDCDSENTYIDESNDTDDEMEEDYDSQKTYVEESYDDSNISIDEEDPPVSDSETLDISMHTIKKRKMRLLNLFGDSNNIDEKDGDHQLTSEGNDNEPLTHHNHADSLCHNDENSVRNFGEEMCSDDEAIKVSENTLKKRKKRMSTLFDDDIEISAQNNGDNEQIPKNKRYNSTNHTIPVVDKSGSEEIEMNKGDEDRPDLMKGVNDHECFLNAADHQVQNKEACCKTNKDCDMDPAFESTSTTLVSIQNNSSVLRNVKFRDDDRLEVDLIDCLLKEYNTPNEQENDKEKDCEDDREPSIHNDQTGVNIDSEPLLSSVINDCFENIQITNVRSIAKKLYIFICQECFYATDTYDDTIRHCQNHYNHIEDPVTYCNICQIKYASSCFERHEISHDKYLTNIKIEFSYQWLFSNWQRVFENNNILLGDVEDMQVQSIYKTMCVKVTVKEAGPWQSALYLCAKCNIIVPSLDIEKHVQQNCTLKDFPCAICHRAFSTHEILEHHKIYHTDEVDQPFKTIIFNEKDDEQFNSKLIQAKLQTVQNKEKQRNVELYKCVCGLCFITLKQFKLHFVDCESDTNDGVQCTTCLRLFLPSVLETHMSLHHSAIKCEFRVQQITFREERDYESSEPSSVLDTTSDNNDEDLNIKREMLKNEKLSQGDTNIVEEDSEILSSLENAVQQMSIDTDSNINTEVAIDELLLKIKNGTEHFVERGLENRGISDNSTQLTSIAEDINSKRDSFKRSYLSHNMNEKNTQKPLDIYEEDLAKKSAADNSTQIKSNYADLNIKREMLKDEVSSQNTIEEDIQEYTKAFEEHLETMGSEKIMTFAEDLNGQKGVLQGESFSQNTNEENSHKSKHAIGENFLEKTVTDDTAQIDSNNKDLTVKRDTRKDETLSEKIIEEDTQEDTVISEETKNKGLTNNQLIVQGHNIERNLLNNNSTSQNTNNDIKQRLHIKEIVNKIENPTQMMSSDENLSHNVPNNEANLESDNGVEEGLEIETENSKVVETEVTIVIEDSDDDVELVEEYVNDQEFVGRRAYPDNGNHWELLL